MSRWIADRMTALLLALGVFGVASYMGSNTPALDARIVFEWLCVVIVFGIGLILVVVATGASDEWWAKRR